MEIPTRIRFDFLLFLMGILLILGPALLEKYLQIRTPGLFTIAIIIIGAFIILASISFIKYEYDLEVSLKELEYVKKKYGYISFLEKKKLLTKKSKEKHIKEMKEIIN